MKNNIIKVKWQYKTKVIVLAELHIRQAYNLIKKIELSITIEHYFTNRSPWCSDKENNQFKRMNDKTNNYQKIC
jgi:hypothetical protein